MWWKQRSSSVMEGWAVQCGGVGGLSIIHHKVFLRWPHPAHVGSGVYEWGPLLWDQPLGGRLIVFISVLCTSFFVVYIKIMTTNLFLWLFNAWDASVPEERTSWSCFFFFFSRCALASLLPILRHWRFLVKVSQRESETQNLATRYRQDQDRWCAVTNLPICFYVFSCI